LLNLQKEFKYPIIHWNASEDDYNNILRYRRPRNEDLFWRFYWGENWQVKVTHMSIDRNEVHCNYLSFNDILYTRACMPIKFELGDYEWSHIWRKVYMNARGFFTTDIRAGLSHNWHLMTGYVIRQSSGWIRFKTNIYWNNGWNPENADGLSPNPTAYGYSRGDHTNENDYYFDPPAYNIELDGVEVSTQEESKIKFRIYKDFVLGAVKPFDNIDLSDIFLFGKLRDGFMEGMGVGRKYNGPFEIVIVDKHPILSVELAQFNGQKLNYKIFDPENKLKLRSERYQTPAFIGIEEYPLLKGSLLAPRTTVNSWNQEDTFKTQYDKTRAWCSDNAGRMQPSSGH